MKIVHLCLCSFYIDNSTYQENILSKYHKKLGYDVEIIAPLISQCESKFEDKHMKKQYINENGIIVSEIKYKGKGKISRKLSHYYGVYQALDLAKPDIIFMHGCQSVDTRSVVSYLKKHSEVKTFVDNHADFLNSAKNPISKYILHKCLWRYSAQKILPFVEKFYGVVPARVDFLVEVYHLPREKVDLLVMGADDDLLENTKVNFQRERIRSQLELTDDTILVATGGKIDHNRPEILRLMEAIININRRDIQLLIFGSCIEEYRSKFEEYCKSSLIHFVGWLSSQDIYNYFAAADLIVFPGLHSVLWEQAVGMGKPCIFRRIKGFEHIDLGGNCSFFDDVSVNGIRKILIRLIDSKLLDQMKTIAETRAVKYFSYRNIAKKSIQGL